MVQVQKEAVIFEEARVANSAIAARVLLTTMRILELLVGLLLGKSHINSRIAEGKLLQSVCLRESVNRLKRLRNLEIQALQTF